MSGWFRLHNELLDDPKVQMLPARLFKALINLWCIASRNDGVITDDPKQLGIALRMRPSEAQEVLFALYSLRFFDKIDAGMKPNGWDKRQYISDNSTIRTKAYRKRERSRNVTVTPPDTDTDTDKIMVAKATSRRKQLSEDWKPPSVEGFSLFEIQKEVAQFRDYHTAKGSVMKDWDAAFRTWMRNSRKFGAKNGASSGTVVGFRRELAPEPPRPPRTPEEQARIDAQLAKLKRMP